jgi:hypothetical protein
MADAADESTCDDRAVAVCRAIHVSGVPPATIAW